MFCRLLFVLLFIFFWPLCCLFFFDIRILINPLVSSNSSSGCIHFEIIIMPHTKMISECSSIRSYRNMDEVWWRNWISLVVLSYFRVEWLSVHKQKHWMIIVIAKWAICQITRTSYIKLNDDEVRFNKSNTHNWILKVLAYWSNSLDADVTLLVHFK